MVRSFWMLLLGLLVTTGCEQKQSTPVPGKVSADDVKREAGEAVDTAAEYSQQAKEDFVRSLNARLTELDAEIANLREKGRDLKDEAKADWDQKLVDLETKREAARVKLDEVGNSTAEAWKDVQQGAKSAWDELDKAVRDAAGEF